MEFHDIANVFPLLEGEEFRELCKDIESNGQQQPILTYEEKILDGRNRYRACVEIGEEPWVERWVGDNPVEAVMSLNLHRRHLTSGQKAMIGVEAERMMAKEAKKRTGGRPRKDEKPTQKIAEVSGGESREQAAKLVGTNRQYISDAKKLQSEDPEAAEAVRRGEVSLSKAMEPYRKTKAEPMTDTEPEPTHPPLAGEDRRTAKEVLSGRDIELPPWDITREQKAYWSVSKHLVAISRLDPAVVAEMVSSEDDAETRITHADAIVDWFSRYRAEVEKKREELRPGNLRVVGNVGGIGGDRG